MMAAGGRPDDLAGWLAYLERLHPTPIAMGLERVRVVHARLRAALEGTVITVAGTNGKGSTCAMLDAMLRAGGYSVALYTSPHLLRYNERVVIDGPCLSACTLVLMTVPSDRIWVTRRAVLGFHAARSIDRRGRMYAEPEASKAEQAAYPEPIRNWISRRGGQSSRMLLLRGRELAAIYPRCS